MEMLPHPATGVSYMRKNVLSYLFLPLFAGFSVSASAAPTIDSTPVVVAAEPAGSLQSLKLNLNTADAPTLQKELNGIGKAKAEAIVAYREAHGPFEAVDELLEIQGIGKALLDRNRQKLTVE